MADAEYLQTVGEGKIGYSRLIQQVGPADIRSTYKEWEMGKPPVQVVHDGIEDYFTGKGSSIYYLHKGKWIELFGSD